MLNGGSSKLLKDNNKDNRYKIGYHNFLKTETHNMNGWNHYHIFERKENGDYDELEHGLDSKAHSFFGPMFLRQAPYINDCDRFPQMS